MKNIKIGHPHPIVCLNAGHSGKINRSSVVPDYYESEMTWKLHDFLAEELNKYGIETRKTRQNQEIGMDLYARGQAAKGCDLWLSLHSNACDTESVDRPVVIHLVSDSRTDIDEKSKEIGMMLGQTIYEVMQTNGKPQIWSRKASTDKDGDGVLNDEWYAELRGAHDAGVPGLILEHSFHTNKRVAQWLLVDENLRKLAAAEAKTIAEEWFGVDEPAGAPKKTIYRVQVGAFDRRENAMNMKNKLKQAGFEGFITEVAV